MALAYATVRDILDLDVLWAAELAGNSDEGQRIQALLQVRELVEHLTSWVLRNGAGKRGRVSAAIGRLITAGEPTADAG